MTDKEINMNEQNDFEYSLSCARFIEQARPLRAAYRSGDISYTQLRRELEALQPKPVQTPAQKRASSRMAIVWLRKARAAGKASLWHQHETYTAAARRSIDNIQSPVWRARMSRAADSIAAMAAVLEVQP